jgi:hypothetical protein
MPSDSLAAGPTEQCARDAILEEAPTDISIVRFESRAEVGPFELKSQNDGGTDPVHQLGFASEIVQSHLAL